MEFLKEWTLCVCVTLIISVVFSLLSPSGSMNGFFKIMISIFIFISFLNPFKNINSYDLAFDYSISENSYQKSEENSIETMINNQVSNTLNNNAIYGASVTSDVELDNDNILVNSVQIAVSDDYNLDEVKTIVFDNLGINAKVIHIGD